mgnify:CR=1 FL=1
MTWILLAYGSIGVLCAVFWFRSDMQNEYSTGVDVIMATAFAFWFWPIVMGTAMICYLGAHIDSIKRKRFSLVNENEIE